MLVTGDPPTTGGAVMMHEPEEHPHVGGARGAASEPAPDEPTGGGGTEAAGAGDVEIPIGVPVDEEEFRRLKEEASLPRHDGAQDRAQADDG
jgi:hypothetical protein